MPVYIILFCYILLAGDITVLEVDAHDCGFFPSFTNGIIQYPNKITTVGSEVHLSCEKGYQLQGPARSVCSSSGWGGGDPTCLLIECDEPPKFAAAQLVETEMIEFPVDTVLTYQCRQGYVPTGIDSQIICRQDGLWTDLGDICKPKDCGNVPDLPNGKISYPSGVTTFGSEVLMSCNEGYRLNGRTRRICLSNGWDNGNPTCTPHDCGPFPSFTNGIIQYPNKTTTVGSEVHLSCEEWYQLEGQARRVCSSSGWSIGDATCVPIECDAPPKFVSAQLVETEKNEFPIGTVLTYQCRKGYVATETDNRIICRQNRSWTDLGDLCKPYDCGTVPDLPNGKISYPKGTMTFGSDVIMSCNEGYRLKGRTRRVCLSNGWDNGNPTCVPVMCPKPEVKDGHVVYENGLENRFNTSVTFKCNEGFTLTGSLAVACNKDGRWDPPLPTCEGGHNKSVEEYRARLLYHVRTMPTSTEGGHNKSVEEYRARLLYHVRTMPTSTEGIHNKTGGEYPTRLSDGVRTSDVPLGNTEGVDNKSAGEYPTMLSDGVRTSDVPLGNTEGSRNEEASGHFLRFAVEDSIDGIHNKTVGEYPTMLSDGVRTSDVPLRITEGVHNKTVGEYPTMLLDGVRTSDVPLRNTEGVHNKTVGEYLTRISDGVRTSDVPLGNIEGVHNKAAGEYPTRLSDGVSTSDVPLGNTEGIHNKTAGEYPTRLSDGVSTSDVPLGNTEGVHNKSAGEYPTRLSDGVSTSDVPLGSTEGSRNEEASGHFLRFAGEDSINDSTRMLWYLLPIPAFLFCVGGVMFIIYMKKCRGSYSTYECKGSPQSQRSSFSASGEQTSLIRLTTATV